MHNEFRLKNRFVHGLLNWLQILQLSGPESRERTRFVEMLVKHQGAVEKDRVSLLSKYANKDKEGDPSIILTDGGKKMYDVPEDNLKELNEEYRKVLEKEFVMDITDLSRPNFQAVRQIVLYTDYKFGPVDGEPEQTRALRIKQSHDYLDWCKAFEEVELS